ncbi:hypothetical protein A3C37_01270 [Candidatus Peribacteria bacterium RIFCSPHIGHO2_02_FULL_53_20]|nr:MAG: hypothetical protein A3C37_01270 [Candidatus Peribacteria bacterium RIFCSPHIGHO2_02_FULL_53_20]OGJ68296.1 MAG: hypothetical protein A3B61_01690 [Candidatus Peribacteria bacterium RIFCSPLOWO2_01_FULL_53_10]OGJ73639.1 MAG: hypothetical protein A3G69_00615 [Candidatus Peribacteria bacterium RIFCSPLOWO2_12_FULL_53_10]
MPNKNFRRTSRFSVLMMGAATVASAFFIGIETAGDVHPIALIEAGSGELRGDVSGNGALDLGDAIAILEIVQGYRVPTPEELRADPNGDGLLTVDDALRILATLDAR